MSAWDRAWNDTHAAEGGFVDDPNDSGGATNHGITERLARSHGYTGPMIDLDEDTAREIAKSEFWDPLRLDRISEVDEAIAMELFDTGYNAGRRTAGKMLQRALNALNRRSNDYPDMVVDGLIGNKTLGALSAFLRVRRRDGRIVLLRCLNGLQLAYYVELVERREKDERFLFGWVNHRVVI